MWDNVLSSSFSCGLWFVQLSQHHLLKAIFSLLYYLGALAKNKWPKCKGLSLGSQFYSVELYVHPMPIVQCLDCCNLISFEIRNYKSSCFLLLFQDHFGYPGSLQSLHKFYNSFISTNKKPRGILMAVALNPTIKNMESSNPWTWMECLCIYLGFLSSN